MELDINKFEIDFEFSGFKVSFFPYNKRNSKSETEYCI